ncbi:helix-turn-helix domain-containing protein [Phyllobacterium phragmitis]|uniref:helix-turn-helix domain-containing protein n=1 Tax=Phyllobacterium phragmitis TaxID=2670329 RepID=UPI003CC94A0C
MPWKECSLMDERLKFIARLLDGEKMAAVCREFNISRKTGHKLLQRYRDSGLHGLTDRSRRPYRQQGNRLKNHLCAAVIAVSR